MVTTVEDVKRILTTRNMIHGAEPFDASAFDAELKKEILDFHGIPADAELTKSRVDMYYHRTKEPRRHPSQEKNKDLAYLMSLDQKTREFIFDSMTPNMSGKTHYFSRENYTCHKLKPNQLAKVKRICDSFDGTNGLELVVSHFERFNCGTDRFEITYAKEPFPNAIELETVLAFSDEQVPDRQRIQLLNHFLEKRNLELNKRYDITARYDFGIYHDSWLEKNCSIEKIKGIGQEQKIKLLKSY